MTALRIGIDVGGTNTDAVLVDDQDNVVVAKKAATTPDPFDGIRNAMDAVLEDIDPARLTKAMLGTTHPANAIIERRGLGRVAVLRLAAPSSLAIRPGAAWPHDLHATVIGPVAIVGGGYEFDGREIAPLDEEAVRSFAGTLDGDVVAIAISSAFAPACHDHEERAAQLIAKELGPDFPVTLSHQVGSIGLLERENATVLNASLLGVARRVVDGFQSALLRHDLHDVDLFLTQNDGTLMTADEAGRLPILTVGSGPTNSMRGACALAGLSDAVVIDVGGTSADAGILVDGFPRESMSAVEVGGVRTNFRMPDLISIGLGGGTRVRGRAAETVVGPDSVGYRVTSDAWVHGGDTLTLSDISVEAGRLNGFGDPSRLADLDRATVEAALGWVDAKIHVITDRIRASRTAVPLIAVGGGSHLIPDSIPGVTEVIRPAHGSVANAFGAAIAEASGAVDRVYSYQERGRDNCLDEAKRQATDAAVRAGADPARVRIISVAEVPLSYLPGQGCRVQVKAAGPIGA